MESYLKWMAVHTATSWWHDSARPTEISEALQEGALGVTTNPVLTYKTLHEDAAFWAPRIHGLPDGLLGSERAEELLKIVAVYAASFFAPVYERTRHQHGYALGQVNPEYAGDAVYMTEQGLRFAEWAPNIAVKLPTTLAALQTIETLASRGVAICTTLNFTVSQAVAAAEAYERGAWRAKQKGVEIKPCFVVQQGGRLDDYISDCVRDSGIDIPDAVVRQAGNIVTKRTYDIFRERGYTARLMPAGLRTVENLTRFVGADMVFSLQPRIQRMVNREYPSRIEHIGEPSSEEALEQLMRVSEFCRAYHTDGLHPSEFIAFGLTQRTASQFLWTGWCPLETYGTVDVVSNRWF